MKTFIIHKNDAGTEAYRDQYVHELEEELQRLKDIIDGQIQALVALGEFEQAAILRDKKDNKDGK